MHANNINDTSGKIMGLSKPLLNSANKASNVSLAFSGSLSIIAPQKRLNIHYLIQINEINK